MTSYAEAVKSAGSSNSRNGHPRPSSNSRNGHSRNGHPPKRFVAQDSVAKNLPEKKSSAPEGQVLGKVSNPRQRQGESYKTLIEDPSATVSSSSSSSPHYAESSRRSDGKKEQSVVLGTKWRGEIPFEDPINSRQTLKEICPGIKPAECEEIESPCRECEGSKKKLRDCEKENRDLREQLDNSEKEKRDLRNTMIVRQGISNWRKTDERKRIDDRLDAELLNLDPNHEMIKSSCPYMRTLDLIFFQRGNTHKKSSFCYTSYRAEHHFPKMDQESDEYKWWEANYESGTAEKRLEILHAAATNWNPKIDYYRMCEFYWKANAWCHPDVECMGADIVEKADRGEFVFNEVDFRPMVKSLLLADQGKGAST